MLRYKCETPDCESSCIEEIMVNCTVTQRVFGAERVGYKGGQDIDLDYGEQQTDYGEVTRYQCEDCGQILEGVDTPEELYQYLEEHQ